MKQRDIQPCVMCQRGVMHDNNLAFYRLDLQYLIANVGAIQRQSGLEMLLGGHARIALALGPDEDMATPISQGVVLVCLECATTYPLAAIAEHVATTQAEATTEYEPPSRDDMDAGGL